MNNTFESRVENLLRVYDARNEKDLSKITGLIAELVNYINKLEDDVAGLRATVQGDIDELKSDTADLRRETQYLESRG